MVRRRKTWTYIADFVIEGVPRQKDRPRFGRGRRGQPVTFNTPGTKAYEALVGLVARSKLRDVPGLPIPAGVPIRLEADLVFPRPKYLFRKSDPTERIPMPVRPDLSNVIKAVEDGLNKSGVWWDDGQVSSHRTDEWYGAILSRSRKTSERACVELAILAWAPALERRVILDTSRQSR
jgi:Holliday junction resolvase RusA-like endonuclease